MPKYSIIVPVYNGEKTIARCLNSIISQTYNDWECIVINDGSKDKTLDKIKYFANKDKRIKIKTIKNSGVSVARNTGIQMATGEYIAFCDADDLYEKDKLKICNNVLIKNPNIQILWHAIKVIEGKNIKYWHNKIPGTYHFNDKNDKIMTTKEYDITQCYNKIYKRDLIVNNNIVFPVGCTFGADLLFNIAAYVEAGSITNISNPLYVYHFNRSHNIIQSTRKLSILKASKNLFSKLMSKYDNFKTHSNKIKIFVDNSITRDRNVVDYVFAYVTMSDPHWIEQYNKYVDKGKIDRAVNTRERFRSFDEMLKIKFRCIEQNTKKFNGVVHMVVSNKEQVPSWVDTSKINVVCHDEFMPKELLPTFNSNTIELFLQDIFGLSEKFVYSNDDFLVINEITPGDMFTTVNKEQCVKMRFKTPIPIKQTASKVWAMSYKNASQTVIKGTPFVKSVYNKYIYLPQHVHKPLLRSVCQKIYNEHKNVIYNSCTRFREEKNIAHYIYLYWFLYNKRVKTPNYQELYFSITKYKKMLPRIKNNRKIKFICINDTDWATDKDYQKCIKSLKELLPYLNNKSKFEK